MRKKPAMKPFTLSLYLLGFLLFIATISGFFGCLLTQLLTQPDADPFSVLSITPMYVLLLIFVCFLLGGVIIAMGTIRNYLLPEF